MLCLHLALCALLEIIPSDCVDCWVVFDGEIELVASAFVSTGRNELGRSC